MAKMGQLISTDIEVLRFLARFGVATAEMVHEEILAEQKLRNAYRRLEVLKLHKLVKYRKILFGKPGVWWATGAGVKLGGVDLPTYEFNLVLLEHTLEQVNLRRAILARGEGFLRWSTEREARKQTLEKPFPDALVAFEPNQWTALELELNNKRSNRYTELLQAYANKQYLEGVRFYFKSQAGARRAAQIATSVTAGTSIPPGYFRFYAYWPEGLFSDAPSATPASARIRDLDSVPRARKTAP